MSRKERADQALSDILNFRSVRPRDVWVVGQYIKQLEADVEHWKQAYARGAAAGVCVPVEMEPEELARAQAAAMERHFELEEREARRWLLGEFMTSATTATTQIYPHIEIQNFDEHQMKAKREMDAELLGMKLVASDAVPEGDVAFIDHEETEVLGVIETGKKDDDGR